jgi:hypothetical protein
MCLIHRMSAQQALASHDRQNRVYFRAQRHPEALEDLGINKHLILSSQCYALALSTAEDSSRCHCVQYQP